MYYTSEPQSDGFGAQLQKILWTILYVETQGDTFVYSPIKLMEHNYLSDNNFISEVENYIGINTKYINTNVTPIIVTFNSIRKSLEDNIDSYHSGKVFNTLRYNVLSNKISPYDSISTHVAVHVRRPNLHDTRIEGTDTPDSYYLSIMNNIREARKNEHLTFHIYSQGDESSFSLYLNFKDDITDIKLHINKSIPDTFNGLLFPNILITSKSSFSYIAALFSNAEVHYKKFWHPPLSHWKSYD